MKLIKERRFIPGSLQIRILDGRASSGEPIIANCAKVVIAILLYTFRYFRIPASTVTFHTCFITSDIHKMSKYRLEMFCKGDNSSDTQNN